MEEERRTRDPHIRWEIPTTFESHFEEGHGLTALSERRAYAEVLIDAIEELPAVQREVVELRIWGRYAFSDIAEELKLESRQAAFYHFTKAIERMRENLEERGYDAERLTSLG